MTEYDVIIMNINNLLRLRVIGTPLLKFLDPPLLPMAFVDSHSPESCVCAAKGQSKRSRNAADCVDTYSYKRHTPCFYHWSVGLLLSFYLSSVISCFGSQFLSLHVTFLILKVCFMSPTWLQFRSKALTCWCLSGDCRPPVHTGRSYLPYLIAYMHASNSSKSMQPSCSCVLKQNSGSRHVLRTACAQFGRVPD